MEDERLGQEEVRKTSQKISKCFNGSCVRLRTKHG